MAYHLVEKKSLSKPLEKWGLTDIESLLDSKGGVLFQGFSFASDDFVRFTEQMSSKFLSYKGGAYSRELVDGQKNIMTVNKGAMPISLHGEMYYKKVKPDLIWFYCNEAPKRLGETTVCDGIQFFSRLSQETQSLLLENKIVYQRTFGADFWPKIFRTRNRFLVKLFSRKEKIRCEFLDDGRLVTQHTSSAVRKVHGKKAFVNNLLVFLIDDPLLPERYHKACKSEVFFEDKSPIPPEVVEELTTLADALTEPIRWNKGDFCVIDNRRNLHGRRAVDPKEPRSIYTRLASVARWNS